MEKRQNVGNAGNFINQDFINQHITIANKQIF